MAKQYDPALRFQTIADTARTTGLSTYYLRRGCRDGSLPYIRSGNTFMINVPLLIKKLNEQSTHAAGSNN